LHTKVPPKLNHLRAFGCVAYMHIPQIKEHNFEQKSITIMFVVCDSTSKAYCSLNVGDTKDNNIQGHGV
jgi:hypothetical protein